MIFNLIFIMVNDFHFIIFVMNSILFYELLRQSLGGICAKDHKEE